MCEWGGGGLGGVSRIKLVNKAVSYQHTDIEAYTSTASRIGLIVD